MSQRQNRGISCSRTKLNEALARSQLAKKTQIALAEAIADKEGLEAVPKDLVNKVFRELPVDPQTIERVAAILEVPAESLYQQPEPIKTKPTNALTVKRNHWLFGIAIVAVLAIGLTLAWWGNSLDGDVSTSNCYIPVNLGGNQAVNDKISVVIGRFSGDSANQAQLLLATKLAADTKLQASVNIYTSCFSVAFTNQTSIRDQIVAGHTRAKQELALYNAQMVIWGERYGDRVNLRFTSTGKAHAVKQLLLQEKRIQTTEIDFSLNTRLDDDKTFSGDLQVVVLGMLGALDKQLEQVKTQLIQQFNYSGSWLKEAVISDSNLLKHISAESDPNLYRLTVTQLCFRRRLLGDMEGVESEYNLAEQACQQALAVIDKAQEPMLWASIKGNLASSTLRKQLFAQSQEQRLALLTQAQQDFASIQPIYDKYANKMEAATFYQNYASVYIRLAEAQPQQAMDLLAVASTLSGKSIALSEPDDNPLYYAQRLQNRCVLQYRLGSLQQSEDLLRAAIQDCQRAQEVIRVDEHHKDAAMIMNNLAISYAILAELKQSEEAFIDALASFNQAQTIYSQQQYPLNWAEVEINKAELQCKLALVSAERSYADAATESAESALLIFMQRQVKPYQQYAENLLSKLNQCAQLPIEQCECSS